jgi:hypothetical protein
VLLAGPGAIAVLSRHLGDPRALEGVRPTRAAAADFCYLANCGSFLQSSARGQRDCPRFLDELYRVCSTAGTTRLSEDTASELLVMRGGECELSIQLGIFEVRLGARPISVILGGIRL